VTTTTRDRAVSVLPPSYVRYYVLAALCAITAINYIQRNCIGAAETTIRADLDLTKEQTGDAMAWFFWTYALFQIPSGWLAQTWGPRRALTLYAVGWSLAIGLGAVATGLTELIGVRLAMGALQAGIFPCATMIMASWLPPSRRAFASGLLNSFMLIGGAVSSMLTGFLLTYLEWREVFALYALPGIAWAVWFAFWFRNRPRDHSAVNEAELEVIAAGRVDTPRTSPTPRKRDAESERAESVTTAPPHSQPHSTEAEEKQERETIAPDVRRLPFWAIFLSLPMWLIGIQQFFRAGANRFFDSWLPTYLQEVRGGSVLDAGMLSGLPMWAGVVGGLAGGWISDTVLRHTGSRTAGRKGVAIGSLLIATLCYVLAYPIADARLAVLMLSAGSFIGTFASPCAYSLTMDMGGKQLGVVFGTMNMAGNFGAWAFVWIIPRLVKWWDGWDLALAVFAGVHLLAAVCWLALNPRGIIGGGQQTTPEGASRTNF